MILFSLLAIVFVFLTFGLVRTQISARRLSELSWENLITKLEPVDTDGITAVAVEYLNPGQLQKGRGPELVWNMIGRAEGLSRMQANADVLIALAAYAQQWNPEEGLVIAERMRRDGMALRRAIIGIGLAKACGYGRVRLPSYIHEAASAYYLMRLRLLTLYQTSHSALYLSLAHALETSQFQ